MFLILLGWHTVGSWNAKKAAIWIIKIIFNTFLLHVQTLCISLFQYSFQYSTKDADLPWQPLSLHQVWQCICFKKSSTFLKKQSHYAIESGQVKHTAQFLWIEFYTCFEEGSSPWSIFFFWILTQLLDEADLIILFFFYLKKAN